MRFDSVRLIDENSNREIDLTPVTFDMDFVFPKYEYVPLFEVDVDEVGVNNIRKYEDKELIIEVEGVQFAGKCKTQMNNPSRVIIYKKETL